MKGIDKLPPNSKFTLFKSFAQFLTIFFPVMVDPVKLIIFTNGWEVKASPAV